MWGRPKNRQPEVSSEETAAAAAAAQEQRLRDHIAREPGFRITTVDGLYWICPYSLALVQSPFDPVATAVQHLTATKPWAQGKPRPLADILVVKWTRWFKERWEFEAHIRQFGPDGRWLNPFTGVFEDRLVAQAGQSPEQLVTAMATLLASGPDIPHARVFPAHRLEEILAAARLAASPVSKSALRTPTPTPAPRKAPPLGGPIATPPERSASEAIRREVRDARTQTENQSAIDSLQRAKRVIAKVLPDLPTLPGYDIAVAYEPMDGIGGDFYDFIPLSDGRILIFLGDVSGHGPEAALVVTLALKALRMIAPRHAGLVEIMTEFNDNIRPDLPAGIFITAWVAVLDPGQATLTAVCCGHHPALLASLHRQNTLRQFGHKGPALGLMSGGQAARMWRPESTQLQAGDLLLQFTDGLFEVQHPSGLEFGHLRAWGSCIANLDYLPSQVVARMVKEVKKFGDGKLQDDLTLLAIGLDKPGT